MAELEVEVPAVDTQVESDPVPVPMEDQAPADLPVEGQTPYDHPSQGQTPSGQGKTTEEQAAEVLMCLLQSDIFRAFATYATIVLLKMMVLSYLTVSERVLKGVYIAREDYESFDEPGIPYGKIRQKLTVRDPYIERIRRCHRNDLENIVPFLIIGLFYVFLTDPSYDTALLHFRIFTVSRFVHSVAYLLPLPQPCRLFAFLAGSLTTISMAMQILYSYQL